MNGLVTIGPGTFLDDLISIAGGINVFADATGTYPMISKESLLARAPDVIIELYPSRSLNQKTKQQLLHDWQEFADIPAISNECVHFLTNDFLLIPGPRVAQIADELAKAIHPKHFP